MRPFECNRCHARTYSEKTPKTCSTCQFAKFSELVSICLIVPVEVEPNFPIVHESQELQTDDGGVATTVGQKWVTACKAKIRPTHVTAELNACTCYKCKQWIDQRTALLSLPEKSSEPETQSSDNTYEGFEDDDTVDFIG